MINILMYVSTGIILVSYFGYILLVLLNKEVITNSDGFNATKDILNKYDSINIIEASSIFTIYNIKRKVIKISSKCYYGNSISDISIPLMEAGISVISNKFIIFMRNIINNLKCLYILPIVAIILNYLLSGTLDAKVGIFILVIFSIISYMLINIRTEAILWISKKLKIKEKNKVISFLNRVLLLDKFIFIGELIMIIRFVAIILEFN